MKSLLCVVVIVGALAALYVLAWSLMAVAAKSDKVIKEIMGRDNG